MGTRPCVRPMSPVLVQANAAFLQQPLFCPQEVRLGHIERRFTEDLEWAKDKPEILKRSWGNVHLSAPRL